MQPSPSTRPPRRPQTPPPTQAKADVAENVSLRPLRNRKMRERRTAYAMMAFGLTLGTLELFILFHYL
jgi:hypothetical protein